jgi:collagen type III alpha
MTSDGQRAGQEPAEAASGQPDPAPARASASVPGIRASASVPAAAPPAGGYAAPQTGATPASSAQDSQSSYPTVPPASPAVPAQRVPADSRPTFSASASVPSSSRISARDDPGPVPSAGIPPPRPRVYGTPSTPPGGPYPTVPASRDVAPGFAPAPTEHHPAWPPETSPPSVGGDPPARGAGGPATGTASVPGVMPQPHVGSGQPGAGPEWPGVGPRGPRPGEASEWPPPGGQFRAAGVPPYGDLVGLTPAPDGAAAPASAPTAYPWAGQPYPPAAPPYPQAAPPAAPPAGQPYPQAVSPAAPPAGQPYPQAVSPAGHPATLPGYPAGAPGQPQVQPSPAAPGAAYPRDDQSRFDAFRSEPDQSALTPQVRSGRVLVAVIAAAVLLLVVPLGIVWLVTRPAPPTFEVGECVRQSGTAAVEASCADGGAYRIVAKTDSADRCEDIRQPYAVLPARGGKEQVLCLQPAAGQ